MEFSFLVLVGIALATMFFGYFFGLIEGRGQGYKRRTKDDALERQGLLVTPPIAGPAPAAKGRQILLELGQSESGIPQLRVDGREVDALRVSATERRRLIDLMIMLKPWVEPGTAQAPAPPGVSPTKPAIADRAAPPPRPGTTTTTDTQVPIPTPAVPAVAGSQMSLVAQIDSILQGRLAGTALATRGIRLAESLHGGAIVFVGSTQYDGVDKVTDPEIQTAIRAAIAEWEQKYTPG